jgi:hypothetical protein
VAFCGIVICLPQLGSFGGSPETAGRYLFHGLVASAFLLGCCGCFLTSDAISFERREGTLPLLVLTRVKPFDILLGKMGSNGLACLSSMLALLPLLMLPVLMGGVTGGEAFRKAVGCLNALFFALAVGLYQSAHASEKFKAGLFAGLTVIGFLFLPYATILLSVSGWPSLSFLSPLDAIFSGRDAIFRAQPSRYMASLISVQIFAWVLLKRAAACLDNWDCHEEKAVNISPLVQPHQARVSRKLLWNENLTPIAWLFRRQRGLQATVWAAALITFCYQVCWVLFARVGFLAALVRVG